MRLQSSDSNPFGPVDPQSAEYQLASLILRCLPQHYLAVQRALARLPYVELGPGEPDAGKCVVLIEANSLSQLTERMRELESIPNLMSALVVFHQCDRLEQEEAV